MGDAMIGPNFTQELKAAGLLGLPFSWGADGSVEFSPAMTQTQRNAVLAVMAAHDPLKPYTMSAEEKRAEVDAGLDRDRMWKLSFEVNYQQENRLRVLEAKPTVSREQYLDALKDFYEGL